ncbi:MAG: alanine racemase [Clostridia bacterium]|nr:alanine racemase [Clostridia bacterium]
MTLETAKARCWAEIDLDALKHNYLEALSILDGRAQLICVLKANAYGLGAKRVAKELYELGARFFAVACACEAEEIRPIVPGAEILIMGLVGPEEAGQAVRHGISLTVFNRESAETVLSAVQKAGTAARVHVKTDTGLHRIGFDRDNLSYLPALVSSPYIQIKGLYSHLALRDREHDLKQFELFDEADAYLKSLGADGYMRHICDSIGMVRYPERHMDAVRAGAWLYGVCPYRYEHPERDFPTVRFMTRVSDLHTVPAGECVGYDDEHPLKHSARVATLSAGYVDGFARLNNVGEVEIRGKKAPVLGLVCMDQMMVDVSEIPACKVGDEVTLLGGGIGLNDYAAVAKLNRNEALSRLGRRVPKIYIKDGKADEIVRDV